MTDQAIVNPSHRVAEISYERTARANCLELFRRIRASENIAFHRRMACALFIVLTVSFVGCKLTQIHTDVSGRVIAIVVMFAMVSPLPLYWNERGRIELREGALVILWGLLFAAVLSFPVLIAARLRFPLQDSLFGRIDESLGVRVPGIVGWANQHWLGTLINGSYPYLLPLLAAAGFAPALMGHMKRAREFVLANLVAFAIGLPLFAVLPAVGPWNYYHLAPASLQAACEAQLFSLRLPGPYMFQEQSAGIICFPSFHVIWAILCAAALRDYRPLRVPAVLLSAMIVASTLTTGWHYVTDVLGGIGVAVLAMAIARIYAV
jgi:PAP2 superfamily